ncbi:VanZ family protein [Halorarum halophilum]|uniref:VanZ family protein n=1 Tax=Halorarum halophilum TaxID=2743090 RepID=A0A7D5GL25_9EURY|nr:VanZ family protein [Halobaculum halophilum]QLG27747.1 VanZ family protein [Halobaculum halophilum]
MSDRRWATFAAVTTAVVVASLLPVSGGGPERFLLGVGLDKWAHGLGYAAVSLTFARSRGSAAAPDRRARSTGPLGVVLSAIVVGFTVGAGVELLQAPLATRTASVADAGANAVGAVIGGAAWLAARR